MKLFILISDPAGDRVIAYTGMDQATITSLQTLPFTFIDEVAYDAFVKAHLPPVLTPAQVLVSERNQAISELVSGAGALTKLQRAVLLTILDEVNVIRTLLPSAPAPRTAAQFRTAVQNKLSTGAAD